MELQHTTLMVSAGCMLFCGNQQLGTDVTDSMLYAQLFASKKHSRFSENDLWRKSWLEAALYLGWNYRSSLSSDEPVPCPEAASFWDWAKVLCPAFVSQSLLASGQSALQRSAVQQAAFTLFTEQVLGPKAKAVALQVGLIDSDNSLTLLQLYFKCLSPLSRDSLFAPLSPDAVKGNIRISFHRLLLSNEAVYQGRRQQLFRRLEDRRSGLVLPVQAMENDA